MYNQRHCGCKKPHYGACPSTQNIGMYPSQVMPGQTMPNQMMPTQTMPAQVSPTKNIVNKNVIKTIVPHVHPTHTTTVNEHIYQHQHYFPQTQSVVDTCYNENVICGQPVCHPNPCIHP